MTGTKANQAKKEVCTLAVFSIKFGKLKTSNNPLNKDRHR
jgi:hypothetical protein